MSSQEIQEHLLAFITSNFVVERQAIDVNKSMIDAGIIDSFGLIEITAYLKRTHGITVEERDMVRENFGSVMRIVDFVQRKLKA